MYEDQIKVYSDAQVKSPRGFLRMIPLLSGRDMSFTYHFSAWRQQTMNYRSWFEHQYMHLEDSTINSMELTMIFRRSWFKAELLPLCERWLGEDRRRRLNIVTDDAEMLRLSQAHVRYITDLVHPIRFDKVYENWLYRFFVETGISPWGFRSKSMLLQSFAFVEHRLGNTVRSLEELLLLPHSLLTLGIIRKIYAPIQVQFPLLEVTSSLVNNWISPFIDDKTECELITSLVAERAYELSMNKNTAPGVQGTLALFEPISGFEQQILRVVEQSVI